MTAPTTASLSTRRRGRPPVCPPEVRHRVVALYLQGLSLAAISYQLNSEGVPTPDRAKQWNKSRVYDLLGRRHVREYIDTLGPSASGAKRPGEDPQGPAPGMADHLS